MTLSRSHRLALTAVSSSDRAGGEPSVLSRPALAAPVRGRATSNSP